MKELLIRINKKYKVKFYFTGGVSMNVKMYNHLGKLKFVRYLYSPPSEAMKASQLERAITYLKT